jgi:Ca2+-binding EF-hand superfamily protein
MGFNEFKDLFTALNGWKQNFMMFDRDRSGTVEPQEMSQAVSAMGEARRSQFEPDAFPLVFL